MLEAIGMKIVKTRGCVGPDVHWIVKTRCFEGPDVHLHAQSQRECDCLVVRVLGGSDQHAAIATSTTTSIIISTPSSSIVGAIGMWIMETRCSEGSDVRWSVKTRCFQRPGVRSSVKTRGFVDPGVCGVLTREGR